ncbi:MAG: DUF5683 domain-containing protein [Tannerella sp.]|jgi:hypothetical protein|nr:DUF5683 domain-containing protein [Tannerella sp.]
MCKGKNLNCICIVLSVVYLFLTGITGIIHAQETIPEIKKTDSTVISNDSIATINDLDTIRRSDSVFSANSDSVFSADSDGAFSADSDGVFSANSDGVFSADSDSVFSANSDGVSAYGAKTPQPLFYNDDSMSVILSDSAIIAITKEKIAAKDATAFKPNPKTAYLMAAIFPGFGQIYNRQYWKLPVVYGGFVGFIYAITWNNKNLQDYSNAYFDIKRDYAEYIKDPASSNPESWSQNWKDFTSPNRDPASYLTDTNFHNQLKSGKDFYRRYRDLSIILSVAFYLICMADSYVDAQMYDFDISPDLSFRIAPEILPATMHTPRSFGLNVCMTF